MKPRVSSIARWILPLLAGTVVLVAGGVVSGLRSRSLATASADAHLLAVRYEVSVANGLAWGTVAQDAPNFPFARELRQERSAIAVNLRALGAGPGDGALTSRLELLDASLWHEISRAEDLIAQRRPGAADAVALTGIDRLVEQIGATIRQLQRADAARIHSADANLYDGTLVALGATGLLVALLALVYAAAHRRELAAERAAIRRSEQRFRALVHRASEVVFVVDRDGQITYVTEASRSILGIEPEDLIGHPIDDFLPAAEHNRAHAVFERIQRNGPVEPREWAFVRPDGTEAVLEARSENRLDDPNINGIVSTIRDVSSRRQMELALRHQALHDSLTGLANRTLFEDRVRQALQRARRTGRSASVIYIDLDEFKSINDSLGHAAGDDLLRVVAGRIDGCLRACDTPARLGGDEFACLLEDVDDPEKAFVVARRIEAALEPPVLIGERAVPVQASLGLAFSEGVSDPEQLVRHADLAMYSAKERGGGRMAAFHDDLLIAAHTRLELREHLPQAARRGEMALVYQPLVTAEQEEIVGLEALLRWTHPVHGAIGPDRFIALAEETGAIVGLGRWVIDQALADLSTLSADHPTLRLNVNVSPRELLAPDFVAATLAALERHGIAPTRLTVELTESADLDEVEALPRLKALAGHGVRISIDDFGIGLSSLARLQRLPVDQVKIDRSFLAHVDENRQDEVLLRSILELAAALGLEMVAEGVERVSQAEILRTCRCPLAQGYLYARPEPLAAVAERLRLAAAVSG